MLRKNDCQKELERMLGVFQVFVDVRSEERFYSKCCGIVHFLERMGVFTREEALDWLTKFSEASYYAYERILQEEGK